MGDQDHHRHRGYFNPRPPRGGRLKGHFTFSTENIFQSTPSARRATLFIRSHPFFKNNFNPRPPRGGRQTHCGYTVVTNRISIHALREEGDKRAPVIVHVCNSISIHALREEGDDISRSDARKIIQFQSTPSARRATSPDPCRSVPGQNFNPRPPRGGRRPIRRFSASRGKISIHALREEGDDAGVCHEAQGQDFNPRPPRGGRRPRPRPAALSAKFQSTPSARRATFHAGKYLDRLFNFNPRPPRGGRLLSGCR